MKFHGIEDVGVSGAPFGAYRESAIPYRVSTVLLVHMLPGLDLHNSINHKEKRNPL